PQTDPSNKFSTVLQVNENLTKIIGKHTLRVGFEFQDIRFPCITPPTSRGAFTFNGEFTSTVAKTDGSTAYAQFLLSPIAATVANGINNVGGANSLSASSFRSFIDLRRLYAAGYVQDNWRLSSK